MTESKSLTSDCSDPATDEESESAGPAPSGWYRFRRTILFLVLATEIALIVTLYAAGWNGTTMFLGVIAAGIPLLVGVVAMAHRGRRFSIRSMLVATACFATFIVITLQPALNAQRARQTTLALERLGMQRHRTDEYYTYLKILDRDFDPPVPNGKQKPAAETPIWLRPIMGRLLDTPRDDAQFLISTVGDEQLKLVCDSVDDLPNLRILIIESATPGVVRYFGDRFADFSQLEIVILGNTQLPDGAIEQMTECQVLSLVVRSNTTFISNPTLSQLAEIADLPRLDYLIIDYPITDSGLMQLASSQSISKLHIHSAALTPTGINAYRKSNPDCELVVRQ